MPASTQRAVAPGKLRQRPRQWRGGALLSRPSSRQVVAADAIWPQPQRGTVGASHLTWRGASPMALRCSMETPQASGLLCGAFPLLLASGLAPVAMARRAYSRRQLLANAVIAERATGPWSGAQSQREKRPGGGASGQRLGSHLGVSLNGADCPSVPFGLTASVESGIGGFFGGSTIASVESGIGGFFGGSTTACRCSLRAARSVGSLRLPGCFPAWLVGSTQP